MPAAGPVTAAGKAKSSQNSTTHGLTARHLVVHPDDLEEFQNFIQEYQEEIRPEGAIEQGIFGHLVHAAWNLQRLRRLETELVDGGIDPILDDKAAKTVDRLSLYASRHERAYYRALKELRTAQDHRLQRALAEPELVAAAPSLSDPIELTERTRVLTRQEALNQLLSAITDETNLLMAHARIKRALDDLKESRAAA